MSNNLVVKQVSSHTCDIILPIYNGLDYVKECIASTIKYSPKELFHLYIVDDCRDTETRKHLLSISDDYKNITVVRNK